MKSSLPNDFAMKLIDKEIELESDCSIHTLTELVELYRIGIVYYEEVKNPKFWDFQSRLQKILTRPAIFALLQEENQRYRSTNMLTSTRKRPQTQTGLRKSRFEQNKKELNLKLEADNAFQLNNSNKNLAKIIATQDEKALDVIFEVVSNLKSQEVSLADRIKQRKLRMLSISSDMGYSSEFKEISQSFQVSSPLAANITENSTSSSFFFEFDNEKSLNYSSFEDLESGIEKIMEENFSEKAEKISEIKVKYETQINEFIGQGAMFEEIIKKMRQEMREEIEKTGEVLDNKRRELIAKAKIDYSRPY